MNSNDYHDYVIKDGKLLGEFEQMYKNAKNIPWHQDEQEDWFDIRLTLELLMENAPYDYILDFGAGLGFFLNILGENIGTDNCTLIGMDISETACIKAKGLFENANFMVFDLRDKPLTTNHKPQTTNHNKRLFCIRGTLWYVFPKINNVVHNIANHICKGERLLVSQNFPPLDSLFVGKDIIPDYQALIHHFSPFFSVKRSIWFQDFVSDVNDNWFIGLFERKGN